MASPTACGADCARHGAAAPLRDWLSILELKLDLRLWSFCCISGKVLELCAQQLKQAGLTVADMDCWTNSLTR